MKNRTIHPLIDRLYIVDFNINEFFQQNKKIHTELEMFNMCPYILKCYVSEELQQDKETFKLVNSGTETWNSTNNKVGLLEIKIVSFDGETCKFLWYDDHHHEFTYETLNPNNYLIQGNIIISNNEK